MGMAHPAEQKPPRSPSRIDGAIHDHEDGIELEESCSNLDFLRAKGWDCRFTEYLRLTSI